MVAVGDKIRITGYQGGASEGIVVTVTEVSERWVIYDWRDSGGWRSDHGRYEVVHRAEPEAVNHPAHYNQYSGFEVFDIVEQLNFNKGSAVKYVLRAEYKGKEVEDLKKAIACLEREVKRVEDQGTTP